MHNLKTNFDKIFPIVKQQLKQLKYKKSKVGRPAKFSDASVIALSLTAASLGIDSENYLFSKLNSDYKKSFPDLITRSKYNIRVRNLSTTIEEIRKSLISCLNSTENVFSIDSMPLEVCRLARAGRVKICKEQFNALPAKGYCATQKQFFYGYKLHAVVGMNGAIAMYDLTPGNVHDNVYLNDVRQKMANCYLIGDKAYASQPIQLSLFEENNLSLFAPQRSHNSYDVKFPHRLKLLRKRVETTFSQLCDQFNTKRNYAKSFNGFACRIITKITAFSLLQYINAIINQKPQNKIKHALA
jgi:Transposase DDE domain